jgi:hypothetical protein
MSGPEVVHKNKAHILRPIHFSVSLMVCMMIEEMGVKLLCYAYVS